MPELLVQQVLQAAQTYPWIRRVEHQVVGKVARLRLFLADDRFVVSIEAFLRLLENALSERGVIAP
jgi:hypothetical protein